MNPGIFRAYDIQGIAGQELLGEDAYNIGRAMGTYLLSKDRQNVSVGWDCRETSENFAELVIRGLIETGCHVTDIGLCPTPVFYYAIRNLNLHGGVMVTASYNPAQYNGFKLCVDNDLIRGQEIQKIRRIIEEQTFAQGRGSRKGHTQIPAYMDHLRNSIKLARPLKIGIDAGNGTGGVVAVPLIRELGCDVQDLYCDMDGTFPNHEADPTKWENMKELAELVVEEGLDVGIGYDIDSDRIGVIDETGRIVSGDRLMILFAREI